MTTKNLMSDKTRYALAVTQAKTNHGLGLLLSLLTIGLWLPFWGVITLVNKAKRDSAMVMLSKIKAEIDTAKESNSTPGLNS